MAFALQFPCTPVDWIWQELLRNRQAPRPEERNVRRTPLIPELMPASVHQLRNKNGWELT